MRSNSLLAAHLVPLMAVSAHPGCATDRVMRTSGGVRDLGYTFNRNVPYGSTPVKGRRMSASMGGWSNIRIQLEYVSTSALTPTLESFLKDTLMPSAMSWIEGALLVQPVTGALKHSRNCSSAFSFGVCAEESPARCGVAADTSDHEVQPSFLDELQVCTTCYTDGTCDAGSCSTSPAGAGVSSTDFYLFVSSVTTPDCSGGTLAYAATCERDQNDRPIFGYANFCPASLDTAAAAWETQRSTAVHEILHALGFSSGSWPLFRHPDGTPMTVRESDGLPALVSGVTCTPNVDGSPRTGTNVLNVSEATLQVATERGTTVTRLVTPRAQSVARQLFGCSTLSGPDIENQPTGGGCYGSHWDQRLFMNELMAPISSHVSLSSALTLAALEDSGWYKANYSLSEPLLWGRDQGCDFVNEACVGSSAGIQRGFCDVAYTGAGSPAGAKGCTPGHKAKGYCDLTTYSGALPSQYQYFTDPTLGGSMETADYCPHYRAFSNNAGTGTLLCSDGTLQPAANDNPRGEVFGGTSSCFDTQVLQDTWTSSGSTVQACYQTRCNGGTFEIGIDAGSGSIGWVSCPTNGAWVSSNPVSGLSGGVQCPEIASLLCDPHACPGLPCDGTDGCNAGICTCGDPFDEACVLPPPLPPLAPSPSTPPPLPPAPPLPPGLPPLPPPSPTAPPPPGAPPASSIVDLILGLDTPILIAIGAGAAVAAVALIICLYCVCCRKSKVGTQSGYPSKV